MYKENKSSTIPQNLKTVYKQDPIAIVIGFKSIGQSIFPTLKKLRYRPVIIESDMERAQTLPYAKHETVDKEPSFPDVPEAAQIKSANLLVITTLHHNSTLNMIQYAYNIHPEL